MKAPSNVTELRRFLGTANHLSKFSSNLATLTQLLRQLAIKQELLMGAETYQEAAITAVKQELTTPTVLTLYDPNAATKISADVSGTVATTSEKK